ncbi:MAG: hypothetical protein A2571_01540 [Candidatus Vogelbacteria bacterium RIFOXYD1_FULL_44_32]|uniref:Uncharacterized protein n=1 Tax=Candidatus Vogelbacteria bacterium RIFOXYD1_FULL_44_32 TaxID=1802438 RepID=A0A1G2QCY5_9BACT|nr:MAG: hypothetical protein A2571_01540 [Candidatus Vogelbacteria bacterium RIFOXYD1_FULL_44_32]
MKKYSFKKIITILAVALVLVILIYYILGELGGNAFRIRAGLLIHKEEFNEFVDKFLNQNSIKNIQTSVGFFSTTESINSCSRYPEEGDTPWTCSEGEYPNIVSINLASINAVLEHEHIPNEEYQYFVDFMERYKFNGVGKNNNDRSVEIEDKLKGLRYYEQQNSSKLTENNEYLFVKKINEHWFYYVRDWN